MILKFIQATQAVDSKQALGPSHTTGVKDELLTSPGAWALLGMGLDGALVLLASGSDLVGTASEADG